MLDSLSRRYAGTFGRPDDAELRGRLLRRLEAAGDPRAERY
ncbi:hypothetical protein OH807_25110 [Kitasatospora sp. NBC_01560]